jgi:hypothetical protein
MNDDAPFRPDRTLYERWRSHESLPVECPELDPVLLAAYLDGSLNEAEAAMLEQRLAADPVAPEIPSARFIARAQALVGTATILPFAPRPAAPRRMVTAWAAWGAVAASLVLISLVGFSLGMQTERNFNGSTGLGISIDILDQSSGLGDGIG